MNHRHSIDCRIASAKKLGYVFPSVNMESGEEQANRNGTYCTCGAGMDESLTEAGQGATIVLFSDRLAATIVDRSKSGKQITVQRDIATMVEGDAYSESQTYTYERNTGAACEVYSLRKSGRWIPVGSPDDRGSVRLTLGVRSARRDPCF